LHFFNQVGQVVPERLSHSSPFVIELLHDARNARRYRVNVKGEIAMPRLDPGGRKQRARRMQDRIDVRKIRRKHISNR
jgi:hypothetical protein